jgi:hypothetical protein
MILEIVDAGYRVSEFGPIKPRGCCAWIGNDYG